MVVLPSNGGRDASVPPSFYQRARKLSAGRLTARKLVALSECEQQLTQLQSPPATLSSCSSANSTLRTSVAVCSSVTKVVSSAVVVVLVILVSPDRADCA